MEQLFIIFIHILVSATSHPKNRPAVTAPQDSRAGRVPPLRSSRATPSARSTQSRLARGGCRVWRRGAESYPNPALILPEL